MALAGLAPLTATARAAVPAPGPLSFLAIGDWGRDGHFHQRLVADQMQRAAAQIGSRFVVTVGDNFYESGVQSVFDRQWKTSFEDVYTGAALQTPWYATLGNHDYAGNPGAQIAYSRISHRWRMPARSYRQSMPLPGGETLDMFMLDTTPMVRGGPDDDDDDDITRNEAGQNPRAQLRWLEAGLRSSKAAWKLVFGHHPVFSGGQHGHIPEMVASVKPLLERYGVQAYVNGHDHDLQHIEVGPVTYICTGAGSQTRPVGRVAGTKFCSSRSGFTAFRLSGDRLSVEFRDYTGAVLHVAQIARGSASLRKAG